MDERAFFTEKPETRPARYSCPRCRRTNEYSVRWVRRAKKDRLPPGADERDRARFAKLRDHLLRLDDELTCKTCGKKFEIPSLHSLLFLDQLEGLPKDEEGETADGQQTADAEGELGDVKGETWTRGPNRRANLPARFTRPSKGWRG